MRGCAVGIGRGWGVCVGGRGVLGGEEAVCGAVEGGVEGGGGHLGDGGLGLGELESR